MKIQGSAEKKAKVALSDDESEDEDYDDNEESSEDEESKEEESDYDEESEIKGPKSVKPSPNHLKRKQQLTNSIKKLPISKAKKEKLYICVLHTKYSVIGKAAKENGFKITYNEDKDWDLIWHDGGITSDKLSKLRDYQRINHFPGMYILAHKNYLAMNIQKMVRVFDKEYKIAPPTWLLPTDWNSFIEQFNK